MLSHLGSGAVIFQRSLEDVLAGTTTPDDFNSSVWDEWNAKSPRAQADDALVADEALTEAIEAVDESERAQLVFHLGPTSLSFDDYVGMRLNEHAFHTWDIAAALDEGARLSDDEAALVVDNLGRIVAFSGRSDGRERTIAIHTTDPERDFALRFSADDVELHNGEPGRPPDLELPAEAFARAGLRPARRGAYACRHRRRGAARLAAHGLPGDLSRGAPARAGAGSGSDGPPPPVCQRDCNIRRPYP